MLRTALLLAALCGLLRAQTCSFDALVGGNPPSGAINDMISFDDTSGAALYACGPFSTLGGVASGPVAAWRGGVWSVVGGGAPAMTTAHRVHAFDDGTGGALYVVGTQGFGTPPFVARWDGSQWTTYPTLPSTGLVRAFFSFDDGGGEKLYVGVGSGASSSIYRWSGAWVATPITVTGFLYGATRHDDGSTVSLCWADTSGTWCWDGAVTTQLAALPRQGLSSVDYGSGPRLVGTWLGQVRAWDGSAWSTLGGSIASMDGMSRFVAADLGAGPQLFGMGSYSDIWSGDTWFYVERFTGSWQVIGSTADPDFLNTLAVHDDPATGTLLCAGGHLGDGSLIGATAVTIGAAHDGTSWSAMDSAIDGTILGLQRVWLNGAPELFATGTFNTPGSNIVRAENGWFVPTAGSAPPGIYRMAADESTSGTTMLAALHFNGSLSTHDGTSWTLRGVPDATTAALAVHEARGTPEIVCVGPFTTFGGVPAVGAARWTPFGWSGIGTGLGPQPVAVVRFDDGSGETWFAACSDGVYEFDQATSTWTLDGSSPSGGVTRLAVHDNGAGPELHACAPPSTTGAVPIYRRDAASGTWVTVTNFATNGGNVLEMKSLRNVTDPGLYIGGSFRDSIGVDRGRLVRWSPAGWLQHPQTDAAVNAVDAFDMGGGERPIIAGSFTGFGAPNVPPYVFTLNCPGPGFRMTQTGPGGPVTVTSSGMTPGGEYYNIFSVEPCAGWPGDGPLFGLCASTPATWQFILAQVLTPLGAGPIHFNATATTQTFGPFQGVPPATYEAGLFEVPSRRSPIVRITVN